MFKYATSFIIAAAMVLVFHHSSTDVFAQGPIIHGPSLTYTDTEHIGLKYNSRNYPPGFDSFPGGTGRYPDIKKVDDAFGKNFFVEGVDPRDQLRGKRVEKRQSNEGGIERHEKFSQKNTGTPTHKRSMMIDGEIYQTKSSDTLGTKGDSDWPSGNTIAGSPPTRTNEDYRRLWEAGGDGDGWKTTSLFAIGDGHRMEGLSGSQSDSLSDAAQQDANRANANQTMPANGVRDQMNQSDASNAANSQHNGRLMQDVNAAFDQ